MVNGLHLYSTFIDLMATKVHQMAILPHIHPFIHSFIHRRRCQPYKVPASSSIYMHTLT